MTIQEQHAELQRITDERNEAQLRRAVLDVVDAWAYPPDATRLSPMTTPWDTAAGRFITDVIARYKTLKERDLCLPPSN